MIEVATEHLFDMDIPVPSEQAIDIGDKTYGRTQIVNIVGGNFVGPKLSGTVADGDDWLMVRSDGVMQLDCRITLKTSDDEMIGMTYCGYRNGPKEVVDRIKRSEEVEPSEYYHRVLPLFETASSKYAWLNSIVCIAAGHKRPWGGICSVHQVL